MQFPDLKTDWRTRLRISLLRPLKTNLNKQELVRLEITVLKQTEPSASVSIPGVYAALGGHHGDFLYGCFGCVGWGVVGSAMDSASRIGVDGKPRWEDPAAAAAASPAGGTIASLPPPGAPAPPRYDSGGNLVKEGAAGVSVHRADAKCDTEKAAIAASTDC